MSLSSFLPEPTQLSQDQFEAEERSRVQRSQPTPSVSTRREPPPYGSGKSWMPRSLWRHTAQMHVRKKRTSNALAVQVDAEGKIKYDAIARQGQNKDKVVFSKYTDMLHEDHPELQKPGEETVKAITEKARAARNKLVSQKIAAAMHVRAADKQASAQYIRYTPSQQGLAFNSGAKQRVIRMVEMQKDPMEPPRFKLNKKFPPGPPSPPAPVMKSPRRKITVKEQQEWKIPPCISNWKNAKGYTIPLDKRLAADGRGLQTVHINENFAKLADALDIAERKAREAVELRAQVEKKMAQKEKEKKEEKLRKLAKMARDWRAGIKSHGDKSGEETEVRERDEIRHERRRERQHDRNISRVAPDKSFLPEPTQLSQDQLEAEERSRVQRSQPTPSVSTRREPPPYGSRKSWMPRSLEAREAVELRAQVEKKMAQKEKEKKEEKLRKLAKMARDWRAGVKSHGDKSGEETEVRERDEIRHERRRERQHDRNISRAAPDKRSKLQRDQDRDISELIALGQPNPRTSSEAQYDQRLFNQSKGLDSGFAGGEDEMYNVYDQPFRSGRDMAQNIYRPGKNADKDVYGDDLDTLMQSNRFVPDRVFSGADHGPRRGGPVQFEEDPFGLDKFFEEAKQHGGSKRASTSGRSKDYDHEKKRRKE
ncbi:chromatin protein family [Pimephales promelas]|nr:chromatin protein family [Pimephales promelas]